MLGAVISAALSIGLVAGGNAPIVQDWMGEMLSTHKMVQEQCTEPMGNTALGLTESHLGSTEAAAKYDELNLKCTALGSELHPVVKRIQEGADALFDTANLSPEMAALVEKYQHVLTPEVVAQIREMPLEDAITYVYALVELAEKAGA